MRSLIAILPILVVGTTPAFAQNSGADVPSPKAVSIPQPAAAVTATQGTSKAGTYYVMASQPDRERLQLLVDAGEAGAILQFLGARADEGKVWAMLELAAAYARGTIVEQDAVTSLNWFAEAAREGNAEAALVMGAAYARGDILEVDAGKARHWLGMAARHGDYRIKQDAGKLLALL